MRGSKRAALLLGGGGLLLAAAGVVEWVFLRSRTLYVYDFKGFLSLTGEEYGFFGGYLVLGGGAAILLARGLAGAVPGLGAGDPPWRIPWGMGLTLVAGGGMILAASIGFSLLRNRVVTDDEYVYLFQSRLLLHGRFALPAPPLSEFLTNVFVATQKGKWFGQYPPGHPLLLALGTSLGAPRLVPILLTGGNAALFAVLVRRFVGNGWALAGGGLLVLSPLYLLTGATLLSHSTATLALAVALWGGLKSLEADRVRAGVAAGAGLALLLLTRPWTAVTLGIFPALLLVAGARRGHRRPLSAALALGLVGVATLLAANHAVSGSVFTTGYGAVRGPGHVELGFGEVIPGLYEHTPIRGLRNALLLALRFHFWAWGWPLAFLPVAWALGGKPTAASAPPSALSLPAASRGCAAMLGVGFLAYVPYWSIGVSDTGPVKTYELLLPATALLVFGLAGRDSGSRWLPPRAFAAASLLVAWSLFMPVQVNHLARVAARVAVPLERVESTVETPALVFVRGVQPDRPWTWVYGRPNPGPGLDDPILYVRDLGTQDEVYRKLFPERHAYRLEYREGAFRVPALP